VIVPQETSFNQEHTDLFKVISPIRDSKKTSKKDCEWFQTVFKVSGYL